MQNPQVSNPNDYKVVEFHNATDFDFTPEMGCMFDGRPVSGRTGKPGVAAGESLTVPYHIGHRLAENLAKVSLTRSAPVVDAAGIPTGVPLWDVTRLQQLKASYITDMYVEEKPTALSETDRLMAKIDEFKVLAEKVLEASGNSPEAKAAIATVTDSAPVSNAPVTENNGNVAAGAPTTVEPVVFNDKQDVIAELEKRNIPHDKRKSKADLEALLKESPQK